MSLPPRTLLLLLLVFLSIHFSISASAILAKSGSPADSIYGGMVSVPGPPWPDSFTVPIYIALEDTLTFFVLWLHATDEDNAYSKIKPTSFVTNTDLFEGLPHGYWGPVTYWEEAKALGIVWTAVMPAGEIPQPRGKIGDLNFRVIDQSILPGTALTLDTINVPFVAESLISVREDGTKVEKNAPFVCIPRNIVFGERAPCGDVNGSGSIDITDAVYLVSYIFAGGTAPVDEAGGDCDCSGRLNITDAVYLVNFVFGNGPAPCASCDR